MKKIIIILTVLFTTFLAFKTPSFSASAVGNYAAGWDGNLDNSFFYDNADLFSDKEEEEITKRIRDTAQKLEMNIIVFAAGSDYRYLSDYETEKFSDDNYDIYCNPDTDGVFYYMDFSGKKPAYDYISTSGKAVLFYQDYIEDIFNTLTPYLPSSGMDYSYYKEDIKKAIDVFLDELSSYHGKKLYYYDADSEKYIYYKGDELVITTTKPLRARLKAFIFALPIGLIVAVIYYFVVKSKYKFKASTDPSVYVSSNNTRFIHREDRFIRTYTHRTKIESSSGGGGRSGGGGHSGGGHGGGGHHR